jgi:hypothetical protein
MEGNYIITFMKRTPFLKIFLTSLLTGFFILGKNTLAQNQNICTGFYPLQNSKKKLPEDSTCTLIENGFMYTKAEQITKLSGLPMTFVICKTNRVNNAFAFLDKYGIRFIKYDLAFMKKLSRDSTAWEGMLILAHEIGHHIFSHIILNRVNSLSFDYALNGDTPGYDRREKQYYEGQFKQELEADRFAGFIMAKLGIRFEKIDQFYRKLDKYYKGFKKLTHPPIDKRIIALKEGFDQNNSTLSKLPLNLIKFRKETPELVFKNTEMLDHNKSLKIAKVNRQNLLNKIIFAIREVADSFTIKKYSFSYHTSVRSLSNISAEQLNALETYLGKKIAFSFNDAQFEDEKDYLEIRQVNFTLEDAENVKYDYIFMFHIREGHFYIVLFDPFEGTRVVYNEKFESDQISLEVIKNQFKDNFTLELQKVLDNKVK